MKTTQEAKAAMACKKMIAKLKVKAAKKWIYENFGQAEVNKLRDKYIDISSYSDDMNNVRDVINIFDERCMSYNW